ncbi:hypothetical protein BCR41DRAFT_375165 [Lobosporangium transversale]|uniref:PP1-binding domain-containing protein n=1 Tax=Lobosporangium transversale TaxID=64571 RepID=A0A1Y2G7V5_9FUNG|nr:hypothetical protein BCR41DRAFT_375165 [Lobosporangium transversale]ORZ01925.1 hypothetical protein BCR41DRAFT_375165 [Lobosporangium transversale]|eukprot:XP_021876178.1 hypothetical protein BCR41DRAFT_375165 [Lobosporangium transversale]
MIDEPSILNPTCTVIQQPTVEIEPGLQTPSRDKRKAPIDFEDEILGRTPKKVSFGPALSPEIFDETNPPSTPIKRGEQQGTETPRRQGISTPSLLSRLSAVTPSAKPILTPTRAGGRIANWAGLVKPAPLNLLADINQEREEEATGSTDGARIQTKAQGMGYTNNLEVFDEDHSANHSGNDGRDKIVKDHDKEPMLLQELQDTIDGVDEMYLQLTEQVEEGDDDISPPPSPTRTPIGRASTPLLSTSLSRPRRLSFGMYQQEDLHQTNKLSSPTFVSGNESDLIEQAIHGEEREPSITDVAIQLDGSKDNASFVDTTGEAQIQLKLSSSSYSTPPRRTATTMDKTPVHTPVQYRSPANLQQNDSASRRSTPGSASRLALLQLSTQKIRGLPELLQSPSSTTLEQYLAL